MVNFILRNNTKRNLFIKLAMIINMTAVFVYPIRAANTVEVNENASHSPCEAVLKFYKWYIPTANKWRSINYSQLSVFLTARYINELKKRYSSADPPDWDILTDAQDTDTNWLKGVKLHEDLIDQHKAVVVVKFTLPSKIHRLKITTIKKSDWLIDKVIPLDKQ